MTHWARSALALALFAAGCDEDAADAPQFSCESMKDRELVFCDDFNDGAAEGWAPEGGSWSVADGRYLGSGPASLDGAECGVTRMTASLREGTEATDVRMHAELGSLARVDKTLVLRAVDPSNRIELNFRDAPYDDLMVQEIVACEARYLTEEGEIAVEQPEGERIEVDVELVGRRLSVRVDGDTVLDREFDFANTAAGRVGVAVIDNATTTFDSVWVERP
ncbi:MAG TPA: hypothetical protein VIL20_07930 [Sandaracinaceae bacterium]